MGYWAGRFYGTGQVALTGNSASDKAQAIILDNWGAGDTATTTEIVDWCKENKASRRSALAAIEQLVKNGKLALEIERGPRGLKRYTVGG